MEQAKEHSRHLWAPKKTMPAGGLTHSARVIYPSERVTKAEVADYYLSASKWLVPYLERRPLSLLRCPEKAGENCFFQKHVAHGLVGVEKTKEYASIQDKKGLLALVHWGTLEFHASNCRRNDPEHPDQIVIDLDPGPGVRWEEIKIAAIHCREVCTRFGLKSFLKLSGSRGLHVHVPFRPDAEWGYVKTFAKALAGVMAGERPGAYTLSSTKKVRKGVIYIDTLRNVQGASVVAPYSLRARTRSAVALPIEWEELSRIPAANHFTLARTTERLKRRKHDPWREFSKVLSTQRLPRLQYAGVFY